MCNKAPITYNTMTTEYFQGVHVTVKSYHMDKQHIADSSSSDGEEHLPFPYMENSGHKNGDKLRESVCARQDMDIAQAVDHQHTKDSGWQESSEILHKGRRFSFFIKDGKRQETGCLFLTFLFFCI